ncbi:MAG TPA: hypothetical protein VMZ28_31330 [Kofleriaceae bacterium]|nr:hypothetical protein [Kofleriaceae bacterium]
MTAQWTRLSRILVVSVALAAAGGGTARAQSAAQQQAERLNEEGKALFAEKRYEEAYAKFRDAAGLSAEGRFFFNQCYALNFLGRYSDAISACEQVRPAGGDAALQAKADRALVSLREKLAAQNAASQPPPVDPNAGGGTPPPAPPAQPSGPAPDPFVATQAAGMPGAYAWSLGVQLDMFANGGIGHVGDTHIYGPGGAMLRIFGNFIVSDAHQLGIQGYAGIGGLGPHKDDNPDGEPLTMGDIGAALFMHRRLGGSLYMTPLGGLHVALQQPQELSQAYVSLGARAELAFAWLFGPNDEHAFAVTPAINVYFPSKGEVDGVDAEVYGFDKTRSTVGVGIGYTYRFSTPFGSTPLITLE